MDTTLGKRIMLCRKKLGLTQDKLAETLGVTAQAVSKWENDQSCPDITMLPKLASVFGITTDELLGVLTKDETDENDEEDNDETPIVLDGTVENTPSKEKPDFEFHWEPGKRDAIFIAVTVLLVGALTLASVVFNLNVSFWSILWPCIILAVGVRGFFRKFSFFSVACSLFGIYFLSENMTITNLDVSWKLVFPVLVLLLGVSLLVDSFKKPKHSRWNMRTNDKTVHNGNLVNEFTVNEESFSCALNFGDDYRRVELHRLSSGDVDCSFGDLTLDLRGCEEFSENCRLKVDCSFGSTTILVPKSVQILPSSSTAFAGLDIQGNADADASAVIYLDADVSFGSVTVCYT